MDLTVWQDGVERWRQWEADRADEAHEREGDGTLGRPDPA